MIIQFIRFICTLLLILFGSHYFVYFSFVKFMGISNPRIIIHTRIIFVVLMLSFILTTLLSRQINSFLTRWLYFVSSLWYGLLVFLLMASAIGWILKGLTFLPKGSYINMVHKPIMISLFVFAVILLIVGAWQSLQLKLTRVVIPIPNLPQHWIGKNIVHLSDLHLGPFWHHNLINKINSLLANTPYQTILISGDLFDGSSNTNKNKFDYLKQLTAPKGVFFASGNHEIYNGFVKHTDLLLNTNINLLDHDIVNLDGLLIIGVRYPNMHESQEDIFDIPNHPKYDEAAPKILVFHTPTDIGGVITQQNTTHKETYLNPNTDFEVAKKLGISLQLSGHTHQGQIWPFTWLTKKLFSGFDYGLNKVGDFFIYTSSGTGTWGPVMRLGSRSEVVLITLIEPEK